MPQPVGRGEGSDMGWRNVTEEFSEEQRHYKDLYLAECEVLDGVGDRPGVHVDGLGREGTNVCQKEARDELT